MISTSGWIGVDLDGTLAEYHGWKGIEHVGAPVPAMVERVKKWLTAGIEVRIFTARVFDHLDDEELQRQIREPIEQFCLINLGAILPITCVKDFGMLEFYDDRCVRVERNTGRFLGATNMFPNGHLNEDDEGELQMGLLCQGWDCPPPIRHTDCMDRITARSGAAACRRAVGPRSAGRGPAMSQQLLDQLDGYSAIRHGLDRMATERGDYAGCPLPIEGMNMHVEPTYKYAGIGDIGREKRTEEHPKVRNIFWSTKLHCRIAVCEDPKTGEIYVAHVEGSSHGLRAVLDTLNACDAWGIDQESKALELLSTLIRHRQMKQYLLTGTFMEQSPRSGVHYLFRKLRPTVAIRADEKGSRILCAMCLHPIAYYEGSWAGAMAPTDDVISHLMLCRGDEHLFWRRANQHSAIDPAAGLS